MGLSSNILWHQTRRDAFFKILRTKEILYSYSVERVFPIHSPRVDSIKVLRKGDVRRAKLYYLRERTGKATRIKEKITTKK